MFINIAIVDDNEHDLNDVLSYCQNYIHLNYAMKESSIDIKTFVSGEDLLKNYDHVDFDLVIFDIFMAGISGLETAKFIREMDNEVNIIFLTSSDEFMLEEYRVFATGYFIKPLKEHEDEFAHTLDFIIPNLLKKKGDITFKINGAPVDISFGNIIYIDIFDTRSINLHLNDKTILVDMSFSDVCNNLMKDERFLQCHRGVLIDMDYVEEMESEYFFMTNGKRLPISRRKRREVKVAYLNHIINE